MIATTGAVVAIAMDWQHWLVLVALSVLEMLALFVGGTLVDGAHWWHLGLE
jgi:hypothetical protein